MSDNRRFKALLFDFDDTLVPEYEVSDAVLGEMCAEVGQRHSLAADLEPVLRTTAERLIHEHPVGEAAVRAFGGLSDRPTAPWYAYELIWDDKSPMTEIASHLESFRRQVWTEALAAVNVTDAGLAQQMAERLPAMTHERRVPYDDAHSVLETLREKYPMAVVTNGEPEIQALKVEKSGLKHHFDHVVLCDEHRPKPDPLPFRVAMDLLGCEPSEVAMVGNSLANDIAGARNAGIYSFWVNRGASEQEWNRADVQPDATIRHLSELPGLL